MRDTDNAAAPPVDRFHERLAELRAELAHGEAALADLDAQRERLVANLLRLSGAVQVLAELLAAEDAERAGRRAVADTAA